MPDYLSIGLALLLFAVTTWLALRQGKVISQVAALTDSIRGLQEAVATLELQEKLGVIREKTAQVRRGERGEVSVIDNCIAALPLYEYADEELQRALVAVLGEAVSAVREDSSEASALLGRLRVAVQRHLSPAAEPGRVLAGQELQDLEATLRDMLASSGEDTCERTRRRVGLDCVRGTEE